MKTCKQTAQPKSASQSMQIYSQGRPQETHSKATALRVDVKMKDDVRTRKLKVKEKENVVVKPQT